MPTASPWPVRLLLASACAVLAACSGPAAPHGTTPSSAQLILQTLSTLSAPVGGEADATLSVTSADSRTLSYTVSSDSDWLKLTSGASGTLAPGQTASLGLSAQCGSTPELRTGHLTLVTGGGISGSFSAPVKLNCTALEDSTPDVFEFEPQVGVSPGSTVTSNSVTVTGINAPATVTVTGGVLLVNGQVSSQTTVNAGDSVALQVTAPTTYSSTASATLKIGGVSADFSVTTALAPDSPTPGPLQASPNALQFTAAGADQRQNVVVSQSGYSGAFAVGGTCQNFADLNLSMEAGSVTIGVTPRSAGRCVIRVSSATATATITVSITTSAVVVN